MFAAGRALAPTQKNPHDAHKHPFPPPRQIKPKSDNSNITRYTKFPKSPDSTPPYTWTRENILTPRNAQNTDTPINDCLKATKPVSNRIYIQIWKKWYYETLNSKRS